MKINDQIKDEKLQYDFNRKAAEISVLSSSKTDKYKYKLSIRKSVRITKQLKTKEKDK